MKGVIETLKFTDSNGEKYNLYPRTLIECISNQNGDSLEDTLQQYVDTQFSDTYADKTYVAEQIAASNHLIREIVTEIPTAETAKDNVIYMYKVDSASGNDVYQEYQLIGGEVVLVGDTSVDLSNYVQSETLDNYLKITGGVLKGNLGIANGNGYVSGDGTHVGLFAYAVPDDNNNWRSLAIRNTNSNADIKSCFIAMEATDGTFTEYPLLHTGNKPTGTYTGNGDATARTIDTGGIGNGLLINSSHGTMAIVTPHGSICKTATTLSGLMYTEGAFNNGTINLATTNEALNANGVTYTYQVL